MKNPYNLQVQSSASSLYFKYENGEEVSVLVVLFGAEYPPELWVVPFLSYQDVTSGPQQGHVVANVH